MKKSLLIFILLPLIFMTSCKLRNNFPYESFNNYINDYYDDKFEYKNIEYYKFSYKLFYNSEKLNKEVYFQIIHNLNFDWNYIVFYSNYNYLKFYDLEYKFYSDVVEKYCSEYFIYFSKEDRASRKNPESFRNEFFINDIPNYYYLDFPNPYIILREEEDSDYEELIKSISDEFINYSNILYGEIKYIVLKADSKITDLSIINNDLLNSEDFKNEVKYETSISYQ